METIRLFPTLVWRVRSAESQLWVDALTGPVEQLQNDAEPVIDGRRRGERYFSWQSRADLDRLSPFDRLARFVEAQASLCLADSGYVPPRLHVTEMWANRSDPGAGHPLHTHANSFLSAVFYVAVPHSGGPIAFSDTSAHKRMFSLEVSDPHLDNAHTVNIDVTSGDLTIFPSWLIHGVEPNEAGEPRLSVAMNLMPIGRVGTPTGGYELVPPPFS